MLKTLLVAALIIAIAIAMLGIRVFFVKGGKFPDIHIGHNKGLKEKGISCAMATDAQQRSHKGLAERMTDDEQNQKEYKEQL